MVLITAWWSLHVQIGPHHNNRPLRARPLRDLERVLGHRLHVSGYVLDSRPWVQPGLYSFNAFNYIEAATIDAAVVGQLRQLNSVTTKALHPAIYPLRRTPNLATGNLDEATIGAFYWQPPDQIGLPNYVSSGVLLYLPTRKIDPKLPVFHVLPAPTERADYEIDYDVAIFCSTHAKLMNDHWPKFRHTYFPDGCDLLGVEMRNGTGMPNRLKVRRVLKDVSEDEAICLCLATDAGFYLAPMPGTAQPFKLTGTKSVGDGSRQSAEGIRAFTMTRFAL